MWANTTNYNICQLVNLYEPICFLVKNENNGISRGVDPVRQRQWEEPSENLLCRNGGIQGL